MDPTEQGHREDFRSPVFSQLLFSSAASNLATSMQGLTQGGRLRWTELGIAYAAGPCWPEIGRCASWAKSVAGRGPRHTRMWFLWLREGKSCSFRSSRSGLARGGGRGGAVHGEACLGWRRIAKLFIFGVSCSTQEHLSHVFKAVASPERLCFARVSDFCLLLSKKPASLSPQSVLPSGRMGILVTLGLDRVLLAFGLVIFQFLAELGPQVGV